MGFRSLKSYFSGFAAWPGSWSNAATVLSQLSVVGLAIAIALVATPAQANPMQEMNLAKQPIALNAAGEYWIDSTSSLGPEQVSARDDLVWSPTPPRGIYPLRPGQALWIRFTTAPTPTQDRWLLEIPYPALDRASLYTPPPAGASTGPENPQWVEQRAGDLTPVNQWQTPHRHPLLLLAVNANQPVQHLLRIENAQGFSAPLNFVNARYVLREEQRYAIFMGAYFGLAVLGLLVGVAGVLWLRESAYFFYGLCAVLIGLTQAATTGLAGLLLWPNSAYWADRSLVVLGVLGLLAFLQLNATVVYLAQRSKRLNRLVMAVSLAGLLLCAALLVTDSAIRIKLTTPYMLLVMVLAVSVNLWAWRHGDRFGGWLLLSMAPFAVGLSLAVARYLQWLPLSLLTEQAMLASMAFQLVSILAVLAARSQHKRATRRRIHGLDRIDPATGLINQPVFIERLDRMIARSERFKNQSAVLLIDIINSEQTQRDFGRKAADELPLRVAARLLATAREIDSAARLSERRFGMLVEGPLTAEDAASLGPRIVARCLMPYVGLHVECIAQVRVAYAPTPYQGLNAEHLLARLEERLASASPDDRKAVFSLADPPPMPTTTPQPSRGRKRSESAASPT
jgi:diguanylate cyclase (GGDEF)-like protein